jgi:hypothetical protein
VVCYLLDFAFFETIAINSSRPDCWADRSDLANDASKNVAFDRHSLRASVTAFVNETASSVFTSGGRQYDETKLPSFMGKDLLLR